MLSETHQLDPGLGLQHSGKPAGNIQFVSWNRSRVPPLGRRVLRPSTYGGTRGYLPFARRVQWTCSRRSESRAQGTYYLVRHQTSLSGMKETDCPNSRVSEGDCF